MKAPAAACRFAPTALMLGNVVTGCSVVGPAGMLKELSDGLGVSISTAGLLITFGAVVLCVGSPVTAWLTSRIERRTLLAATLAVLALANIASAFAPDYGSLLAIRLVMLAVGVLYTPQAAGTGALIVPEQKRGSTIAYIFLGWSLAAAVGLPLITFIASRYGWRAAYGGIGVLGFVSFLLLVWRLPGGLFGAPVDLKTWIECRPQPDDPAAAADHDAADVRPVRHLHLHGAAAGKTDRRRSRCDRAGVCGSMACSVSSASPSPPRSSIPGGRSGPRCCSLALLLTGITGWALSAGIYPLMAGLGRDLGTGLCLDQFDAAGAPGGCRAVAGVGLGLAQHLGALYRPGDRLGDRRRSVRARPAA